MKIEYAESVGDYLSLIKEESNLHGMRVGDQLEPEVLWFRGFDYTGHPLIPSLFREKDLVNGLDPNNPYTKLHYAEDIRTQHYVAKNYHFFSKIPSSRVEWLEVMQHHEVKTRLLDWSESSMHSLIFALEAFLDGKKYSAEQRRNQVPCVCVLRPQVLNLNILKYLYENQRFVIELLEELGCTDKEKKNILDQLEKDWDLIADKKSGERKSLKGINHLSCIFNLSTVNDELYRDRTRLKEMLKKGEVFTFFYFLSRIYSDGYILKDRVLPPLAVVQPYHSERIKLQKGVFTVFPYYTEKPGDEVLREAGIERNAMQYNEICQKALFKIEIMKPEEMAYELISNGINTSWLYPELPIVANEIESHKAY